MVPSITTTGGQPAQALPLGVVLLISMIKDGIEDYKKAQSDKSENEGNKVSQFRCSGHTKGEWEDT